MNNEDQYLRDLQREYLDFLDDEEGQGIYSEQVKKMLNENSRRLIVNINDLRKANPTRANSILSNAFEEQLAFSRALKEYVSTVNPHRAKTDEDYYVGFEGSFGNKHVTPRNLTSQYLGCMVCVEGIVTRVSLIHPKIMKSVHFCPSTNKTIERRYTDATSYEGIASSNAYPTKDDDGNLLESEFGLSKYKDHQVVSVQEMPEKAPAGQLPRSVDIICDDDLVDKCKPGDRVQIVGSYRCLPGKQGGYTNGIFRSILVANNISILSKDSSLNVTKEEITTCKNLAKNNHIFDLLAKSLAPSIHGHEFVKKAILCLLLGGIEKILPNGTRLRGDINLLLIGDPSVAKSQLLRFVLYTAARAIPTTGRGSSGVGLTAAVTVDQETGERRLEAGAMVLADRGVVCIDEFDKMTDIDRTAIHEVMEQGKVTISKAGVHASLNARCSVLAAANPVYGRYDQYKTPMENIGLQDSLLSRFDLLFVMLDKVDNEVDEVIANHVVKMHRFRYAKENDGDVLPIGNSVDMLSTFNSNDDKKNTNIYERYDPLLHSSRKKSDEILSVEFMRKFIHIAKCMKPKLTQQACEMISSEYSRLRSEESIDSNFARTQPVTARTLETLIRLATAHAKARMAKTVTVADAEVAIELVQFAYFKKVLEKEKKKRRRDSDQESSEDESNSSNKGESTRKRTRQDMEPTNATDSIEHDELVSNMNQPDKNDLTLRDSILSSTSSHPQNTLSGTSPEVAPLDEEKLKVIQMIVQKMFKDTRKQSLAVTDLNEYINSEMNNESISSNDIEAALQIMTENNQIMLADDFIILI